MTPSRAETLRREWHERFNRLLDGLVGDVDYHRDVIRVERMDEEALSGPPPTPRLSPIKRHNWARRMRG